MKTTFMYMGRIAAFLATAFMCSQIFAAHSTTEISAAKKAQKERWKYAADILKEDCSKLEARKIPDELAASVLYQISLRTFTAQGTLKEAQKMLPHLKNLGIDIVYLCPINLSDDDTDKRFWSKSQKKFGMPKNPYRIKDYEVIDPEYGTPEDLKNFVDTAHSNGIRVLLDAVFYHCGPKTTLAEINPDFIRRDDSGEMLLGKWNFPEINYDNPELCRYMSKILTDCVQKYGVDGYRTDAVLERSRAQASHNQTRCHNACRKRTPERPSFGLRRQLFLPLSGRPFGSFRRRQIGGAYCRSRAQK